MIKVVYPGTFDPLTRGHEDLVRRASGLFDKLIVGVADSRNKKPFFALDERLEIANEVLGHYPNVQVENWYGVLAPAGTPREIVVKLNAEINALLAAPDVKENLARQGLTPVGGAPSLLADMIASELKRWPRVASAAGIKAD